MGDLREFQNVVLTKHLSKEARERLENPMKAIWKKAYGMPNMINLANGDPHHSICPISRVDFKVPSLKTSNPVEDWRSGEDTSQILSSSKEDSPGTLSLQTALQYGAGAGLAEVRKVLQDFNQLVHAPPHNQVTLTLGNADGLTKCFRLFGDPGKSFLVEEFSYPGMTNAPLAQGINWVPVRMDREGILPNYLEDILKNWNEGQGERPHVLYTIPSGQNPTGGTLSLERRKTIYQIACAYDLIILEDDPYYFLQYDRAQQPTENADTSTNSFAKNFIRGLAPSFLSMDVQGRALRIDSFSKIIVPGMRLGWITSNAMFAHKLEILTDSSTQHPHGFGQVFVAELLGERGWGFDGYFKWVSSLCDDYQRRRDLFLDVFHREMGGMPYATVEKPSAGMFMWIEVHYRFHPLLASGSTSEAAKTRSIEQANEELFQKNFDAGVVVMPAKTFAVMGSFAQDSESRIVNRLNYLRVTFAGTDDVIERGVTVVCRVIKEFFQR